MAAFVAALRVAASAPVDARSHADRIASLELSIMATRPSRRAHVASLMGAALDAGAWARIAVGLPPWAERPFGGRHGPPSGGTALARDVRIDPVGEAVTTLDVDEAVMDSIETVRALLAVPTGCEAAEDLWDRLERIALAPCFETSASCRGGRDRKRTLLILWLAFRRERPVVAAVLRKCLSLDRAWRAGAAGTA
ncbi:hypothetical protein [Lichenibacterium dinghuense]|uniref:hypothetical protein n=1 Tax=Lichenibacterium dinghuense TaxID=2895977 RepID=UPI001F25B1A3|nr:hypothetical protein [Lichenibacterium sp. 6Y81]